MAMTPLGAAELYTQALRSTRPKPASLSSKMPGASSEFVQELGKAIQSAEQTGGEASQTVDRYVRGKADLQSAVTALMEADVAIKSFVGVRDQVISVYKEILRMQI